MSQTAELEQDLQYATAVEAWALEQLDRVDLSHRQRRLIERELLTALRMREQPTASS